jgi:hypothetical protein
VEDEVLLGDIGSPFERNPIGWFQIKKQQVSVQYLHWWKKLG